MLTEQQYLQQQLALIDADLQLQEEEIARLEVIAASKTKSSG